MTPAQQLEKLRLEAEQDINDIIERFEKESGAFVQSISVIKFVQGQFRSSADDKLNITLVIGLPTIPERKNEFVAT